MKKIKYLLFIFLTIILFKIPNVYAEGKVEIESIDLIDKSEDAYEVSSPTINNLSIGLDLKFTTLNDYIKYKIVVNNSTNEDYELSDKNLNASEYINYEYSFEDDVKVVKKNSKIVIYITAKYTKELPREKFENGEFKDDNSIVISLSNDPKNINNDNTTINPNTSDKFNIYLIVSILSSIAIIGLILTKKTHDKKYLSLLIISFTLIPTSIYALKKIEITINAKTTIQEKYSVIFDLRSGKYKFFVAENEVLDNPDYYDTDRFDSSCDIFDKYIIKKSDNTESAYYRCNKQLIKYPKNYLTGETVNISNSDIIINNIITTGCTREYGDYDQKIICPEENLQQNELNEDFIYEFKSEEELQQMNWNSEDYLSINFYGKTISFRIPVNFKMTNHDVIITRESIESINDM